MSALIGEESHGASVGAVGSRDPVDRVHDIAGVVRKIMSNLSVEDILTCMLVCRAYKKMAQDDSLWRPLAEARWATEVYVHALEMERDDSMSWHKRYANSEMDSRRHAITADELGTLQWAFCGRPELCRFIVDGHGEGEEEGELLDHGSPEVGDGETLIARGVLKMWRGTFNFILLLDENGKTCIDIALFPRHYVQRDTQTWVFIIYNIAIFIQSVHGVNKWSDPFQYPPRDWIEYCSQNRAQAINLFTGLRESLSD